jgi:hypothetical protein
MNSSIIRQKRDDDTFLNIEVMEDLKVYLYLTDCENVQLELSDTFNFNNVDDLIKKLKTLKNMALEFK